MLDDDVIDLTALMVQRQTTLLEYGTRSKAPAAASRVSFSAPAAPVAGVMRDESMTMLARHTQPQP